MQRLKDKSSDRVHLQRPPEFQSTLTMGLMQTFGSNLRLAPGLIPDPNVLLRLHYHTIFVSRIGGYPFAPAGLRPRGCVAASYVPVILWPSNSLFMASCHAALCFERCTSATDYRGGCQSFKKPLGMQTSNSPSVLFHRRSSSHHGHCILRRLRCTLQYTPKLRPFLHRRRHRLFDRTLTLSNSIIQTLALTLGPAPYS